MVAAVAEASRCVDAVHEPLASTPTRIRRSLRAVFAQWELPSETTENALMVVEELVANVVDHARTPFRLTVNHEAAPPGATDPGSAVRITVHDDCPGPVQVRPFAARAARGRGLQMIDALTSRWGCDPSAGGKTVWALVPA